MRYIQRIINYPRAVVLGRLRLNLKWTLQLYSELVINLKIRLYGNFCNENCLLLSNFSLVWDEFLDISFISSMKIYHTFKFLNYLINPQQNYNKFENTYTRNVSTYISITLSLNTKKLVTKYNVYNINFWISIFSYQLAKYIRLVIFIFFVSDISRYRVVGARVIESKPFPLENRPIPLTIYSHR